MLVSAFSSSAHLPDFWIYARFSLLVPCAGSMWAVGKSPLTLEKRTVFLATKKCGCVAFSVPVQFYPIYTNKLTSACPTFSECADASTQCRDDSALKDTFYVSYLVSKILTFFYDGSRLWHRGVWVILARHPRSPALRFARRAARVVAMIRLLRIYPAFVENPAPFPP